MPICNPISRRPAKIRHDHQTLFGARRLSLSAKVNSFLPEIYHNYQNIDVVYYYVVSDHGDIRYVFIVCAAMEKVESNASDFMTDTWTLSNR